MPKLIISPASVADLLSDPQRVRDALALLNALASLEVHYVVGGAANRGGPGAAALKGEAPNLVLPLPLRLPSPIADSTATAASVSTQLNLLLAGLRTTPLLPS